MEGVTLWSFDGKVDGNFRKFGIGNHDLTKLKYFSTVNLKAITVCTGYRARVSEGAKKVGANKAIGKHFTFSAGYHNLEGFQQNKTNAISFADLVVEEDVCVTAYNDGNLGWLDGKSQDIGFGRKDIDVWKEVGKNDVESFKVHQGYMIKIFEHANFKGTLALLGPGNYNSDSIKKLRLANKSFSSLIVDGHGVTIFEHDNFKGRFQPFGIGKHDMDSLDFKFINNVGNNRLCSLKVQKGYRVTLFQNSGFKGNTITLLQGDYDCNKLRNMGFRSTTLSSVIVESEINRLPIDLIIKNNA